MRAFTVLTPLASAMVLALLLVPSSATAADLKMQDFQKFFQPATTEQEDTTPAPPPPPRVDMTLSCPAEIDGRAIVKATDVGGDWEPLELGYNSRFRVDRHLVYAGILECMYLSDDIKYRTGAVGARIGMGPPEGYECTEGENFTFLCNRKR